MENLLSAWFSLSEVSLAGQKIVLTFVYKHICIL